MKVEADASTACPPQETQTAALRWDELLVGWLSVCHSRVSACATAASLDVQWLTAAHSRALKPFLPPE
jgi:hypothetical protein